jgi:ribonuclease P/MRP protein subunit POP5
MVRVKNRYLLVQILYPEDPPYPRAKAQPGATKDSLDVATFRGPIPQHIDARLLMQEIREEIGQAFGDYGAGVSSGGLTSRLPSYAFPTVYPCAASR